MKLKALAALAVLAFAATAHADTDWTITYSVLAQSSAAPTPIFSDGTLLSGGALADNMEFTFVADTSTESPTLPEAIEDFSVADTQTIYFCDGCNIPADLSGQGHIAQTPGSAVFYAPADGTIGAPSFYEYDSAFEAIPDYYTFGTLTFADPPPVDSPEPATYSLLGIGLIGLAVLKRRLAA